jgi:hypothetical protein
VSIDDGFDFFGFAIKRVRGRHGRTVIHTYPSKRALQSVKAKVRQITNHTGPEQACWSSPALVDTASTKPWDSSERFARSLSSRMRHVACEISERRAPLARLVDPGGGR